MDGEWINKWEIDFTSLRFSKWQSGKDTVKLDSVLCSIYSNKHIFIDVVRKSIIIEDFYWLPICTGIMLEKVHLEKLDLYMPGLFHYGKYNL